MKLEIRTGCDSIKLLSADEVFIKLCFELMDYFEGTDKISVVDRESAIEFLRSYKQKLIVHQEKTIVMEIKISFPKLRSILNGIVKSKIMLQFRKVVATIIKEVFIKLMVEIILSLIHGNNKKTENMIANLSLSI